MPQRCPCGGLRQRRQMIGQADELQRVDDGRRRGQVAQPPARKGERLAHRPADHELVPVRAEQRHGAGPVRELGVRLVHDDDPGRSVDEASEVVWIEDCPVGLLGLVRNVTSGARSASSAAAAGTSTARSAPRGAGSHSVRVPPAMIGCIEYEGTNPTRQPSGPAEGLQELLEDLVGAVGGPDVRRSSAAHPCGGQVRGEVGAQRDGVAVRVAVQLARRPRGRRGGDVGDQLGRRRVRVLVRVEPDRDVELRGAVGGLPPQVVAQRERSSVTSPATVVDEPGSSTAVTALPGTGPSPPGRARAGPPRRRA